MASAGLGHGGAGSSRNASSGFSNSSSSFDWLGREMLEMRLRDRVDLDDDRVCFLIECITSFRYSLLCIITAL